MPSEHEETPSVFTLNIGGTLLAIVFGIFIFALGMSMWWFFIAVLLDFLVLSALATRAKDDEKARMKGYEKVRSWKNVAANGIVPIIAVLIYFLNASNGWVPQAAIFYAYVGAVCAITADKFASEFGVLDGEPITLLTMKPARKGRSGAVTWFGTAMGIVASILIGLAVFAVGASAAVFIVVVAGGFVGNIVDSVFGYFEERGIGNKFTSNIVCAAAGFLFCLGILSALPLLML